MGATTTVAKAGQVLLEVRDIHVFYGNIEAIKGVSLEIHEGEIVTLIGANGAGKTTTLNTISGLLRPRSGSIGYAGQELAGVPAYEVVTRGLSQSPEGRKIFPRMSVRENLEMGAFSRPGQDLKADFERVFDLFPVLRERESQPGGTLSGGEQQMLAMGRALMAGPKLLMLDEPSMGLAPMLVEKIFDIIREINAQGTTILLVEQNAHVALEISEPRLCARDRKRHPHRRRLGAAARSARARGVSGRRLSAGPPLRRRRDPGAGERGPFYPSAPHQRSSMSATAAAWSTRSATGTDSSMVCALLRSPGPNDTVGVPATRVNTAASCHESRPLMRPGRPTSAPAASAAVTTGSSSGTSAGMMSQGHSHSGGCSASQSSWSVAALTRASTSSNTACPPRSPSTCCGMYTTDSTVSHDDG